MTLLGKLEIIKKLQYNKEEILHVFEELTEAKTSLELDEILLKGLDILKETKILLIKLEEDTSEQDKAIDLFNEIRNDLKRK